MFRRRSAVYMLLVGALVLFLGPFAWLLDTALKAPDELRALPVHWWPHHPGLQQLPGRADPDRLPRLRPQLPDDRHPVRGAGHPGLGVGGLRIRPPQRARQEGCIFNVLLSTMMLPQILTLIPTYLLFAKLHLTNTYGPWVLWGLCGAPYLIFLFRQFFSDMPRELEEAAIIDGCGQSDLLADLPAAVLARHRHQPDPVLQLDLGRLHRARPPAGRRPHHARGRRRDLPTSTQAPPSTSRPPPR